MVDSSVNQSGRYKAYPEYKHSGVEWLGEIPSSWGVSVMKWCILNNDGGVWGNDPTGENDTIVLRSTEQTVDGKWKIDNPALRKLTPKEKRSAFLKENDLLLTKSSGSSAHIGKTTLVDKKIAELECCYSNFMQRLRVNNSLNPKLVWYLLNNSLIREQFDYLSSTTTGLANLNASIIAETILPICSRKEQNKVVDFLDYETAKIDTLIKKQQRLIELLTEKRQAVISHAVTKGLDPDVPMKASGVEWLGKVPEHWDVAGFKMYLESIVDYRGKTPEKIDSGMFLVTARNIKKGIINYDLSQEYVSEIDYPKIMSRGVPSIGDVLFTTEAPLGEVAQVDRTDIALAQRVIKFNGYEDILDNTYLKYFIMSTAFQHSLMTFATGSTALGIKSDRLSYLKQLIPPYAEQIDICKWIEMQVAKVDSLEVQAQKAIQLMQERRTALISAAVTGKIDVRDWEMPVASEVCS